MAESEMVSEAANSHTRSRDFAKTTWGWCGSRSAPQASQGTVAPFPMRHILRAARVNTQPDLA